MSALADLIPAAYVAVLGLASLHGAHRVQVLAGYLRTRRQQPAPRAVPADANLPVITVQLPIFNEETVVGRLVDAACRLDWPRDRLQVQILDDSTDGTTALARAQAEAWRRQGVDVTLLHRVDRVGFKAGALAAGLATARGDLIAIFDADFLPPPRFLREVHAHLHGQPDVGMVQARWGHLNEHANLLTRLSAVLLDGHFVLEHSYRNRTGRFFNFNGTAGIWRRVCIDEAGGWQHDTLTEDLDLSYRAQLAGWRFVYLRDLVVPAELPDSMRAFKAQQHRWAKGTLQTARKLLPTLLRAPLPWRVRTEALAHMTANLAYPLVLLLAALMPAAVLLRGQGNLARTLWIDLPVFLLATGSVAVFYAVAEAEAWGSLRGRAWRLPLTLALGAGMAVSQTRAVIAGLTSRDATFVRTPKAGDAGAHRYRVALDWTPLFELALSAWCAGGMVAAWRAGLWGSLPFMALFSFGFGYVGLASLLDRPPRTRAPAAEAEADPATTAPEPALNVAR